MAQIDENLLHTYFCEPCLYFNALLAEQVMQLETDPAIERSHLFQGRYENIYIPATKLSHISEILDTAKTRASEILGIDPNELRIGFWLNIMRHGDVTLIHSHDDDDELLSGTYYIAVPDNSARLIVHLQHAQQTIEPRAGMFVFFHPAIPHEVTRNLANDARLSIGFNIGRITDG